MANMFIRPEYSATESAKAIERFPKRMTQEYKMPEYKMPEYKSPGYKEAKQAPTVSEEEINLGKHKKKISVSQSKIRVALAVIIPILAVALIGIVFTICFFTIKPKLTLTGDADVTAEVFAPYTDEGFTAKHMWFDIGKRVTFTSDVDTKKLGEYTVSYFLEYHGKSYTAERHVSVIDSVPPEITLKEADEDFTVSSMEFYTEPGFSAKDNYDGDLTDSVEVTRTMDGENNLCILTYSVKDSFGNEAKAERRITVKDVVPPMITLFGGSEITINTPYFEDPGCAVTDDFDGDITDKVVVTSDWKEGTEGDFTFTYTATDSAGNTASVTRTVRVKDTVAPYITLNGKATVKVGLGESFDDPGATAVDAFDGDVTKNITVSSSLDTSNVGTYYIKYYVEDSNGNGASVTRTVVVFKRPKIINAPYISQNNGYYNGCESVSTVMALQYLGINISVDTFIDKYLDMGEKPTIGETGPDPDVVYCGDPRSKNGWGCNSPVIAKALYKFIDSGKYNVSHAYGRSLNDLCHTYIDNGIPVIVWVTVDMKDSRTYANWTTPDGKQITYNRKLHCMLLVGYDDDNYYFNDPKRNGPGGESYIGYSKSAAENAYSLLGQQSIAVYAN